MKKIARNKGFTLIEILVVIGIIAILAAVVVIAINPARQFAQARNSQRTSNVNTILNGIGQNMADNKGVLMCGGSAYYFPTGTTTIGTSGKDLAPCLVPTYIASGIPQDPIGGAVTDTGYRISTSTTGSVMVCAPNAAESAITGSTAICVVR